MKIWKAELILFYNEYDKWETKFKFELDSKDYKINKKFDEWTYCKDWVMERIPMNMCVEINYSTGFKIIQGFNRELSEVELTNLRNEMTVLMKKQLNFEKENYLKKWDEKSRAVSGI